MSNSTYPSCHTQTQTDLDLFLVCVYSLIAAIGFMFNVIALLVFCRTARSGSRSRTIVYMTNLAVADIMLILTLPVRIVHHRGVAKLPQRVCDVLGLVLKANMYGSIFFLTCMCCDRCLAVTLPMSTRVHEGRKKAVLVCVGVWVLMFGAGVPIYLSKDTAANHSYCFDNLPVVAISPVVVYPTLVFGFGIPSLLMLICSWLLVRAIRRSTVAQTDLVDSAKISRMIGISLLIFLTSFLPYHAVLLDLSVRRERVSCGMLKAYRYSLMMACFNTVLDPVAYYFTTDTFRRNAVVGAVRGTLPLNSQSSDVKRAQGES